MILEGVRSELCVPLRVQGEIIGILDVESIVPNAFDDTDRVMLLDSSFRVIASSDGRGILEERYPLKLAGSGSGSYRDPSGALVGFHLTPGYETYRGLGWYGVIASTAT